MKPIRAWLVLLLCTLPLAAAAQWIWVDKDGRKVFSDRSPPPEVPVKDILKQPGGMPLPAADPAAAKPAPAQPAVAAAGPKISGKDKELEQKRKQAEGADAEKKKADDEKQAQARAESCERAKRTKVALDSGVRIGTFNAKGEREYMDDKTKAAETKRLQGVIDTDCKS